jgi:anaerobic selenocysteine-containing dehydrogenase
MIEVKPSTCRVCSAYCPVMVTLQDGLVVRVDGNPDAPLYDGFTCPKGRALPALHNNPDRLLHSLKRQPDGSFKPIPTRARSPASSAIPRSSKSRPRRS